MRTDDLIVSLVADARPVQLLEASSWRFARWSLTAGASVGLAVWLLGMRSDVAVAFGREPWVAELGVLVVAGGLAGAAAQLSGVPGAAGARPMRAGALVALAAWAGLAVMRLVTEDASPLAAIWAEPAHAACALRIAAVAIAPGAMAWWQLRRAAVLQPGWSTVLAAAGALAAGAVAAQLLCPIDQAAHTLLWHMLPVAALTAAAGVVGATRR